MTTHRGTITRRAVITRTGVTHMTMIIRMAMITRTAMTMITSTLMITTTRQSTGTRTPQTARSGTRTRTAGSASRTRTVRPLSGPTGLIGMGIAGGLVPSPSALIVLLGAIALGRTVFGVLLVLAYGLGMAATLTAAGLLLVRIRRRLDESDAAGRLHRSSGAILAALPVVTSALVLAVGVGLATRGLVL